MISLHLSLVYNRCMGKGICFFITIYRNIWHTSIYCLQVISILLLSLVIEDGPLYFANAAYIMLISNGTILVGVFLMVFWWDVFVFSPFCNSSWIHLVDMVSPFAEWCWYKFHHILKSGFSSSLFLILSPSENHFVVLSTFISVASFLCVLALVSVAYAYKRQLPESNCATIRILRFHQEI